MKQKRREGSDRRSELTQGEQQENLLTVKQLSLIQVVSILKFEG